MLNFFKNTRTKPSNPHAVGLMGFLFSRIEVILLTVIALMTWGLFDLFVGYFEKSASFIPEQEARFAFASRLIGSLLAVKIVLALATAYFRNRQEWDKSIFTAVISFVVALFNHWTIQELFRDFSVTQGATSMENKLLLMNWLVFLLGEAIGFVMHSKGQDSPVPTLAQAPGQNFAFGPNSPEPIPVPVQAQAIGFKPSASEEAGIYAEIQRLRRDGLSLRDIAAATGLSKNGVAKIVNRLGL